MCIAVVVRKGFVLEEEVIDKCWRTNSDGAGFALVKDGKVAIHKGYLKLKDFKDAYFPAANNADSNMLVHFRISTSGLVDASNTHPFRVKDGAMIHNGVLFCPEGDKSDTRLMVDRWYNKLNKDNLITCSEQVAEAIGRTNKLAFLFNDDTYHIVNEAAGNWATDRVAWFSNYGWK